MTESQAASQYAEVTYKVIGAAMRVHNELGPGLREATYQAALSVAMRDAGLSFEAERPVQVAIDEEQVGLFYLDHLVEDAVVVEEKALPHLLTNDEVAQVITYLKAANKPLGLLINFGRRRLEYKRILPPRVIAGTSERSKRYVWSPEVSGTHPLIRSSSAANKPPALETTRLAGSIRFLSADEKVL